MPDNAWSETDRCGFSGGCVGTNIGQKICEDLAYVHHELGRGHTLLGQARTRQPGVERHGRSA